VEVRLDRSRFPVVIVFPQAQPGFRWLYPEMQRPLAELDATVSEFHGDPSRIYLTGFSMGATGAYRIAAKWPDRFAAMFVVAGQVDTLTAGIYPARDIEVDRQTNAFVVADNPFAALADRIKSLPIWVAHGDADETVPVEQSRKLIPALKAAGANLRYTEYPGASHRGAAENAYGNTEIIQWLLSQRRPTKASRDDR
jgi:predicted peptidase